MPTFRLTWEIDLDADNAVEAAKKARAIQLDPASTAVVFDVTEHPVGLAPAESHGEIDLAEVALDEQEAAADEAFERYDFGDGLAVVGHDNWDRDDLRDFTKVVYVSYPEDGPDDDSHKVSFHVNFDENGAVADVYGLEMAHGGEIGRPGAISKAASSGPAL